MKTRDTIVVWHLPDFGNTEAHRGTSVARFCPPHWHEQLHLCAIESGGGHLFYRGTAFATPAQSLFIVHPGEVHSNRAYDQRGCNYRNLYIDPDWFQTAMCEITEKTFQPFFAEPVIFAPQTLRLYLALSDSLETSTSRLEQESLLFSLLARLISQHSAEKFSERPEGRERQAVRKVREYLIGHYNENVSLDQLARITQLSKFYLNRVFAAERGLPPHAFQTQVRVAKAKNLLRQGLEISDVASLTGFSDQSHLNRHFKRFVGVTPGAYVLNYR